MLFYTFKFLFFFGAVWGVVRLLNRHTPTWRNSFLLAASWCFYGAFKGEFLPWLWYVTLITYFFGRLIAAVPLTWQRRVTGIAVTLTLLPLGFFKYTKFLCSALLELPGLSGGTVPAALENLLLPVGISFFTFQALTYTIDLYRRKIPVEKNFLTLALFVAFFPTVLSGPIEKARELIPQLKKNPPLDLISLADGAHIFIWGLFKKLVVADRLGFYVDFIYGNIGGHSGKSIAFAAICYSIQIYCDFSGYSDMAVGVGRALGFELERNFNYPYFAFGIRDFWKRWHISLTSWFTEYLYFACGGNRVSRLRWVGNILLVFLVSGLWHGANWTFLIWGGLHGVFYLLEFALTRGQKPAMKSAFSRLAVWLVTFAAVTFAWIFFRLPQLSAAGELFKQLLFAWGRPFSVGPSAFSFVLMLAVSGLVGVVEFKRNFVAEPTAPPLALRRCFFSVTLLWLVELLGVSGKQFVYFLF